MSGLYASVDIGTNSALLLVASRGKSLEPVHQRAAVPRVGRDLSVTGRISEESIRDLKAALETFRADIDARGARLTGAVATEAFRIAANGPEILEDVSRILGCPARIIAGPVESRLGYLAVADRHPSSRLAVVDIGGGSTEATRRGRGISLPIGAVNLMESVRSTGAHLKPGQDAAACRDRAASAFRGAFEDWEPNPDLVAVGGTATALAMLELKLAAFDSAAIEGLELDPGRVTASIDRLAALPAAERAALPGMEKNRADILMPGLCILEAFLEAAGAKRFRISDRGIRYGIILEWLATHGN